METLLLKCDRSRRYIKYQQQCLITFANTSNFLRVVFSTLFSVLTKCCQTLSFVFDLLEHTDSSTFLILLFRIDLYVMSGPNHAQRLAFIMTEKMIKDIKLTSYFFT